MPFLDADSVLWLPHTGMHPHGSKKGVGGRGERTERGRGRRRRKREISERALDSSSLLLACLQGPSKPLKCPYCGPDLLGPLDQPLLHV